MTGLHGRRATSSGPDGGGVHRAAVLRGSNKEVVIKVLKPGVEDILSTDLSFLYLASRVLEFLNPELERTSMAAIVGDIRASMLDEARGPRHMKCPGA